MTGLKIGYARVSTDDQDLTAQRDALARSASGLLTWTAAQSADLTDPGIARTLTTAAFAAGAAGFVVPLGPIGRFGALLWIIAAAALLPRNRTQPTTATPTI